MKLSDEGQKFVPLNLLIIYINKNFINIFVPPFPSLNRILYDKWHLNWHYQNILT